MKKYKVQAVHVGCILDSAITDTYEEALEKEGEFVEMYIEGFGEENYLTGNGDFCVYIDEIDV